MSHSNIFSSTWATTSIFHFKWVLPFPIKIHPIKIFTRATPGISLVKLISSTGFPMECIMEKEIYLFFSVYKLAMSQFWTWWSYYTRPERVTESVILLLYMVLPCWRAKQQYMAPGEIKNTFWCLTNHLYLTTFTQMQLPWNSSKSLLSDPFLRNFLIHQTRKMWPKRISFICTRGSLLQFNCVLFQRKSILRNVQI